MSLILSRRDFLRAAGIGGAALLFGTRLNPFELRGVKSTAPFVPDAEISLVATDTRLQILPGAQTRVYRYEGESIGGSGVTVQSIPDS